MALTWALGINDVYKAFDHVDATKLEAMLHNSKIRNKEALIKLLKDYSKCNLKIGQNVIRRTRGLPQGAKGAPQMFNYYMHRAVGTKLMYEFVYADNIIFRSSDTESLHRQEEAVTKSLEEYDLKFEEKPAEAVYAKTEIESVRQCQTNIPTPHPGKDGTKDLPTTRVLGYYVKVENGVLKSDKEYTIDSIRPKVPMLPPFEAMKHFKVYIKPKIMFHFKHWKEAPNLRDIFQSSTCIVCVPRAYMEMNKVFDPGTANEWGKYWSIYTFLKGGNIELPKESPHTKLRRWRALCAIMDQYYLSIYKCIQYIFCGKIVLKKMNRLLTHHEFKSNAKTLDLLWFTIQRRYNISKTLLVMERIFYKRVLKLWRSSNKKKKEVKEMPDLNPLRKIIVFYGRPRKQ